jgi:hypothetical protein
MDFNLSSIGGVAGVVSLIITLVDKLAVHKRIRSKCCGRTADMSLEIDSNTSTPPQLKIKAEEIPQENLEC